MTAPDLPTAALVSRLDAVMKQRPVAWRRATGGYSTAERWIVKLEDGRSCFVKSGEGHLATFLRAEHSLVYSRLRAPFLPTFLAWEDDGEAPLLVLEDLSRAHWPPPWSRARVDSVLSALESLQSFAGMLPDLPLLESHDSLRLEANWQDVEAGPQPLLSLDLCSPDWLRMALPALKLASSYTPLGGKDVLHLDVRSDNLCFRGQQTVLVDWNHTCRGNRDLDVAFWLPSLHSEGGPPPEDVSGLQPCWPATVAGYFAARAGLPPISQAPDVRRVQLSQLRSALPWAARALGLRPLDRPGKSDSSL